MSLDSSASADRSPSRRLRSSDAEWLSDKGCGAERDSIVCPRCAEGPAGGVEGGVESGGEEGVDGDVFEGDVFEGDVLEGDVEVEVGFVIVFKDDGNDEEDDGNDDDDDEEEEDDDGVGRETEFRADDATSSANGRD